MMSKKYTSHFVKRAICSLCIYMPLVGSSYICGQQQIGYSPKDDLSTIYYTPKNSGITATLSLVAMFTTGANDRKGIRIGAGAGLSYTTGNWTISSGLDTYKAKNNYGLGTTYGGIAYDNKKCGGAYYLNRYWQGDRQVSGVVSLHSRDFRVRFEDDILSLPFTGFVIYDRYRTAALELEYKGFLLGTNVYTNDPSGLKVPSTINKKGIYRNGIQISSPIYVGYTRANMIVRYGISSKAGGYAGQSFWHKYLFETANFKEVDKKSQFFQIGVNKPYTVY